MSDDIRTMAHQIGVRAKHERERFDFVFGRGAALKSGKGKHYLLNFAGLKEAYETALRDCPIAADAILVLVWDRVLQLQTLEWMEKDLRDTAADQNV